MRVKANAVRYVFQPNIFAKPRQRVLVPEHAEYCFGEKSYCQFCYPSARYAATWSWLDALDEFDALDDAGELNEAALFPRSFHSALDTFEHHVEQPTSNKATPGTLGPVTYRCKSALSWI